METTVFDLLEQLRQVAEDCKNGDLDPNDLPQYVTGYVDAISADLSGVRETLAALLAELAATRKQLDFWQNQAATNSEQARETAVLFREYLERNKTNNSNNSNNTNS